MTHHSERPDRLVVGLTYDLKSDYLAAGYSADEAAEFDSEVTIDGLVDAIESLGHEVERIGSAPRLVEALAAGQRWDLVFNIAEGLHGFGRESLVPALLDAYEIPYVFSDPLVLALSLHKGHCKAIVHQAGVPTAPWAVIDRAEQAAERVKTLGWPLFVKPVAEGTGKGVSLTSRVTNPTELRNTCEQLIGKHRQPVIAEPYLSGREFTVGIVGTGDEAETIGTLEIILGDKAEPGAYTYANKDQWEDRVRYELVSTSDPEVAEAERIALAAWRALGARDGGRIDIRSDGAGQPQFLEVNPLAGLNPVTSDLPMLARFAGVTYHELIGRIVNSALQRVSPVRHSRLVPR